MKQFTCPVCKRQEPCTYEGENKKPTIHLNVPWQGLPLTVTSSGEQCYPCPRCELDENGESKIRTWTQAELRIHKRLRQHFTRHHHGKLADFYTPEEIVKFYDDARRLRCELIHGPEIEQREEPPTNSSKAESPEPPPKRVWKISLTPSTNITLPSNFEGWLAGEVSKLTAKTYSGVIRIFLEFQRAKGAKGTLADVWDFDAVKLFLDEKKSQAKPSTLFNYFFALQSAQKFTQLEGIAAPTKLTTLKFDSLGKQLCRAKTAHYKVIAAEKRKSEISLHLVKEKILDDPAPRTHFDKLVRQAQQGFSLTPLDYRWATGYAAFNLQASNFKRNGNLAKISYETAIKRLKAALRKGTSCELEVTEATKTGGTEVFSVIHRDRIEILLHYGKFIRAKTASGRQDPAFFLNSVGKRITQLAPFIKAVAKSVGLPSLTIKDLRSQIETEAAFRGDLVDRAEIASHLAHTEATRDRHYLLNDHRRSRKAAKELIMLLDRAEPDATMDTDSDDAQESDSDAEAVRESIPSTPTEDAEPTGESNPLTSAEEITELQESSQIDRSVTEEPAELPTDDSSSTPEEENSSVNIRHLRSGRTVTSEMRPKPKKRRR